jgi:D-glycero-D-manno-heptose 1,7-bisphosphate phosphatase
LAMLRRHGFFRIIITNQSGIGRGLIRLDEYEAVQKELLSQLRGEIDAVYFCADVPENASARRKPGTGMVEEAMAALPIKRAGSFFVGDKEADLLCGLRAGLRTALVRTGYGHQIAQTDLADHVCDDVVAAIDWILFSAENPGGISNQKVPSA